MHQTGSRGRKVEKSVLYVYQICYSVGRSAKNGSCYVTKLGVTENQ